MCGAGNHRKLNPFAAKPRIAIFLLTANSRMSGTQKRKGEVMRSKHFLLLVALFIVGATNTAFAQHAHLGGFAHLQSLGGGLTGPATTSGFHPNPGFGSSSAGGSGGTPTGPTIPGSSGAVSGMNLSGTGVGAVPSAR
jgi:hypothetical protein